MRLAQEYSNETGIIGYTVFTPDETDFILKLLNYALNIERDTYELAREIAEEESEQGISDALDVLFDNKGLEEKEVIFNIINNKYPKVLKMIKDYNGDDNVQDETIQRE